MKSKVQKRRRMKYLLTEKVKYQRQCIRRNRIIQSSSELNFITAAISTSEELLKSFDNEPSNQLLIEEMRLDIRRMKGRASKYDTSLQSAMASAGLERLQRKRTHPDRDNDKNIANIKSKRRRLLLAPPKSYCRLLKMIRPINCLFKRCVWTSEE